MFLNISSALLEVNERLFLGFCVYKEAGTYYNISKS
jgi:hypothetical protein